MSLVTTIVFSVVFMVTGPVIEALPAVVALIVFSAVDAGLRYLVISWRALR